MFSHLHAFPVFHSVDGLRADIYTQRMPRQFRPLCTVIVTVATISLTGCSSIYSDTYSPRRSRFVAPAPRVAATDADVLPPVDTTTTSTTTVLPPPVAPAPSLPPAPAVDPLAAPPVDPMAPAAMDPMAPAAVDPMAPAAADPMAPADAMAPVPGQPAPALPGADPAAPAL